jgi:hypothetical protein
MDRSAEAVTARLRAMAALSGPRVARVDRSAAAVTARLRSLAELSALCARLGEAARLGEDGRPAPGHPSSPGPRSPAR